MLINNKEVPDKLLERLVKDIKKKKELTNIEENFVQEFLIKELRKNSKLLEFIIKHEEKTLERSSKYKKLIKDVRAVLRKVYGVFQTKVARDRCLESKDWNTILESHLSTKERLPIYKKLYSELWKITGKPESVIDLGCGMNPFSFKYMDLKKARYFASDISKVDLDLIKNYFECNPEIEGKTELIDLLKIKNNPNLLKEIPFSDVALLFKVLDPALIKNRKIGEQIISTVPAKWVVVSFSTKTISQKHMTAKRGWIKLMSKRLGYELFELNLPGEIFYIIKKQTVDADFIDVHAHMEDDIFDKDRGAILKECKKKKIFVINCSGKPKTNRKALKLAESFDNLKLCLGIYPIDGCEMSEKEFWDELKFIEKNKDKLVGIGEVGIDFYWIKEDEKRKIQIDRFKEIIWMANRLKLPLNVHSREAEREVIALLVQSAQVPVLLHAYGGEIEDARLAMKHGFFFSVPVNVVYNKKRQRLVKEIPIQHLVTETDSPLLGPTKDRNDPRNIPLAVEKIAEIKEMDVETVRKQLVENAKRIFKI